MKTSMRTLARDEKGAALLLAIILLLVGGLIAAPLLAHMGTGILTGEVYETRTAELYAADAGVEDAALKIQRVVVRPPSCPADWVYNNYWSYNISDVNGKKVEYTMTWVDDLTCLVESTATGDGSSTTIESYVGIVVFDIFSGALASKSDIWLKKDTTVAGDIYYVGGITGDPNQTDGNKTKVGLDAFPPQWQNEAFAQTLKNQAMAGENRTGDMTISSSRDLGPIYITGDLTIGEGVVINLKGTVYVGGSIIAKKEYELVGSGSIIAVRDIDVFKADSYNPDGASIIMSLNGDIKFWKEGTISALIYAPNGTAEFKKSATVLGGVVAKYIQADMEGSFTYISKASALGLLASFPQRVEIKTYSINP